MLLSVILIPWLLNYIPLSALAAILIMVGYKLAKPAIFREMFRKGLNQFIPFVVTVLAILLTDLLIGITIGMAFRLFFVIKSNFHQAIFVSQDKDRYLIRFNKDVSFLNKLALKKSLSQIPEGSQVLIDGTKSQFIDHDIAEVIANFSITASDKGISVTVKHTP